jgi:ABC-type lipoprotein export system ATPase subunit
MGKDLGVMSPQELDRYRTRTVGFVWQYGARNLIPYLTAAENIELPMLLSGTSSAKNHQRALELLDLVGLTDRKNHRLEELSGGEQQRVAVGIALANQPILLLADEPTGELDTTTAKTIYDLFHKLNRQLGLTVVIVSHDAGIASHVDRVVAVRDGRLASETLRMPKSKADEHGDAGHVFEELLVLDSAGRISIPREYLERFHFRRHVRMEVTENGIHLRPLSGADSDGEHTLARPVSGPAIELPERKSRWYERIRQLLQRIQMMFERLSGRFGRRGGDHEK